MIKRLKRRLTDRDRIAIAEKYLDDISMSQLARDYQVAHTTIKNALLVSGVRLRTRSEAKILFEKTREDPCYNPTKNEIEKRAKIIRKQHRKMMMLRGSKLVMGGLSSDSVET